MCTHQKLIYTKFSKYPMYVKCGHCKACLQEKAAKRVKRIHDTGDDSLVCLMVALTYSRGTAPFVYRSDAYAFSQGLLDTLPVYRSCKIRKVRKPANHNDYNQVYKRTNVEVKLTDVDFAVSSTLVKTKDLAHEYGKIGVCYYKDYQGFAARLRLNLKRHYNYEGKLFIYACSEFGTRSLRPHFHLLIFCEKSAETCLRSAIIESWPFSNLSRFPRAIERSFRSASYVASYVNQSANFPSFFKDYFKPKHSYSKGFGLSNKKYSLSYILEKFQRGTLKYSVARSENGYIRVSDVPFPSYVINRYFPKFKGYTRCAPSTLLSYMQRICRGDWQLQSFPYTEINDFVGFSHDNLYLSSEECRKYAVRLLNAWKRYKSCVPDGYSLLLDDYLRMHINIWNCYNSTVLRLHLENPDVPYWEKYDNLDVLNNNNRMRAVLGLYDKYFDVTDPNQFSSVRSNTYRFETSFDEHIKHRNIANAIYGFDADCEL